MNGGEGRDGTGGNRDSGGSGEEAGRRIVDGRFELLELLGRGGMGSVWRARDLALHREVALKEVRPPDPALAAADPTASRNLRMRVLREARALARINHPNVVTIHHIVGGADPDIGTGGPSPWLVMELLPGRSLHQRLESGPLAYREAARLGRQVLAGLRAAHAAGIHHRDVKPANVMLRPDGTAVLTDFGIAALVDASPLTVTGEFIGSPEYIAPERVRGADDSASSDLWSLGMLLYVAVEGLSPMRRGSTLATLAAVLDDPVPPPRLAGPLGPVLAALLVRDPAARPDGARLDALLADVEAGRRPDAGAGAGAGPVTPTARDGMRPPPVPSPYAPTLGPGPLPSATTAPSHGHGPPAGRRRHRALTVAGAVLALALVAAGTYVLARQQEPGPRTDASTTTGASAATGGGSGVPAPPLPASATSPSSGASASNPAAATSRTAAAPTRAPERPPSRPAPSAGPADAWIAQLHSAPVPAGRAALESSLASIRRQVPEARVLRSDDFASLRPGYWVVYAPGPFESGRAALAHCAFRGRPAADQCVGRWLSHEAADRVYLCGPPANRPKGRCTRP
ncbi:serine/threonine-protein kinase [Streptomyces candidus]|uniref:non-specific serine/threonine protein kinase n=1 Tax=Streptomyces candidus TaxID=67283 RepID=A0A7X0HBY6_9ACTN|nr:serine/threonine-protein kinase [Streptomyces candidus]MBB6433714.1 serine/threonine protein kinase [Streptomyces candidus]GHH34877.1 hypothetical protein GCM10018773_07660 [Streptomyces candidus]